MALNKAYLTCGRDKASDECLTPIYAVKPLLEFLPKEKIIWCPFDMPYHAFVKVFEENGYKVEYSHIKNDKHQDFFEYEPKKYDVIISNPPFSLKDKVLQRCYALNKPFALLLPVNSLQGQNRFKLFEKNLELLIFDKRIDFHTKGNLKSTTKGVHFGSAFFCNQILPSKLIFKSLEKKDEALI